MGLTCGWTADDSYAGYRVLNGAIFASFEEKLTASISRDLTLSQAVSLWFQKSIQVYTTVSVANQAPVAVQAFVTQQSFVYVSFEVFPTQVPTVGLL
jgi:hypothetical protein